MAYTGSPVDCTGATVTIGGTEIARGGSTRVRMKEAPYNEQELLCFGNFPDPTVTDNGNRVDGSVEFYCDAGQDFPSVSNTPVALVITKSPGLEFNGNVRIRDLEVELGTDGKMKGSFNFLSLTTYTFDNNGS